MDWVSEFLADDLRNDDARLFFYNYDSYWQRDAVHTRIALLSNDFLEKISEHLTGHVGALDLESEAISNYRDIGPAPELDLRGTLLRRSGGQTGRWPDDSFERWI